MIKIEEGEPEFTPSLVLCQLVDKNNALEAENATLREALADMLELTYNLGHDNNSEPARNAKRILGWND